MSKLKGQVALVTGGSRGIGRAISLALAAAGAKVAINYLSRDVEALETANDVASAGSEALLVSGDLGEEQSLYEVFQKTTDHFGGLDFFISAAVAPISRGILEMTLDDWERTMTVNARAFLLGSQIAVKHMADRRGRIIAISSTGTHIVRNPKYAPLALAKGAVEAAVRFLATELAPRGITVNAVAPGPTNTEAFDTMAGRDPAELRAQLSRLTPMGRLGEPVDAANLVTFLCSEDGGWITGQLIYSDGGYSLR